MSDMTQQMAPRFLAASLGPVLAPLVEGPRMLGVGSGSGVVEAEVARLARVSVTGFEPITEGAEHLEPAIPTLRKWSDVEAQGPWDTVLLCDVLHHVAELSARRDLLARGALVAGARIVIKDHYADTPEQADWLRWKDSLGNRPEIMARGVLYPSREGWTQSELLPGWVRWWLEFDVPASNDVVMAFCPVDVASGPVP